MQIDLEVLHINVQIDLLQPPMLRLLDMLVAKFLADPNISRCQDWLHAEPMPRDPCSTQCFGESLDVAFQPGSASQHRMCHFVLPLGLGNHLVLDLDDLLQLFRAYTFWSSLLACVLALKQMPCDCRFGPMEQGSNLGGCLRVSLQP